MYVCICKAVTEDRIHHAIDQGATRLRDLQLQLGVATQCGSCAGCARAILAERCPQPAEPLTAAIPLAPAFTTS